MMKNSDDGITDRAKAYKIDFRPELEPDLEFDKLWVQERRNQLAMLDTFFGAITPEESLVFFYAKRTPLTDDGRRVIVGIGRVLKLDPPVEYIYEKGAPSDAMRCVLWERNLRHSIRPEINDGFLLPYHDLVDLGRELIKHAAGWAATSAMPSIAAETPRCSETTRGARSGHARDLDQVTAFDLSWSHRQAHQALVQSCSL